MVLLMAVAAAVLFAATRRGRDAPGLLRVRLALESRWAPAVVGLLFAAIVWWIWGPGTQGAIHDEHAYLLQARLFQEWRWTAPAPPMPEFFAQAHILNDPAIASKYPPGHSMLLALGGHLGSPAITVLLLNAIRAGLTFALARRLTNGAVALVTTLLLLHGQSLYYGASYVSQTTTGALLLVAWYALLRWHQEGGMGWMTLLALSLGWCAITRPYSALLFAIPIGIVVIRRIVRTRRFRELGLAMALGSAIVAVLPLWSARTTGDWRVWPLTVYTRDYMPYDRPHFGHDSTPPRRTPPLDVALVGASLDSVQRAHTIDALPSIAGDRFGFLAIQSWWEPVPQGALALLGLVAMPAAGWVAVATSVAIFVGYLAHPTWSSWTIYYMETAPVLAFLAVCGFAMLLRVLAREPEREWRWAASPRATAALLVAFVVCLQPALVEIRFQKRQHHLQLRYPNRVRDALALTPAPSIVFIKHARWHEPHASLVVNGHDFARAPRWIAYDLGDSANAALLRRVPDRKAFVFDESRQAIFMYRPADVPGAE